jgi:excisionase family DNA binding protein
MARRRINTLRIRQRSEGTIASRIHEAHYSGIPKDSIRKLITMRKLPAVELPGIRRVLIGRVDLDALIDDCKTA